MAYYITNDNCVALNGDISKPYYGNITNLKKFKMSDAQFMLSKIIIDDPSWCIQKVRKVKSKANYVITKAVLFVGTGNKTVHKIEDAKIFRTPADAEAYIRNHKELKSKFVTPLIIDENFEVYEMSAHKEFTPEQLSVIGKKPSEKKHPRISFRPAARQAIYNKTDGICAICGKPVQYGECTIDHRQPLSHGGSNLAKNLQISHAECNKLKGDLSEEQMLVLTSDISCNYIQRNPTSDQAMRAVRSMVRGLLQVSGFYSPAV